ncbi:MAG: penicillin-binding protein activator [Pseudomonadota bacterium]
MGQTSTAGFAEIAKRALACAVVVSVAACAATTGNNQSGQGQAGVIVSPTPTDPDLPEPVDPNAVQLPSVANDGAVRVALLLPTSNPSEGIAQIGEALLNAAQLALFELGNDNIILITKDTKGTPQGAQTAALEALEEGAEVILGPLFSTSVAAVGPIARQRNVPVIAFSTDKEVAGDGVYLLSFLPEQEVKRITEFAFREGYSEFAALVPESEYGQRVRSAFVNTIAQNGGEIKQVASYPRPYSALELTRGLEQPDRSDAEYGVEGPVTYQAILLPEGGTYLQIVAPYLPKYDVDPRQVKFLGTGLWDDPGIGKEASLVGGWFAAPTPAMRQAFQQKYRATYSQSAPRIASLPFDAVALVASLSDEYPRGVRFSQSSLMNPNGFSGIDGIFRFLPDGTAERGLAVLSVLPDRFEVISDAPRSFEEIDRQRALQTGTLNTSSQSAVEAGL